ncbi:MAG: helix-turn-helix transcriptional regulator [Caldilineales bacterium]|nr:helix-turn-helix transcriptional regulator [Caldilineales bacterium]
MSRAYDLDIPLARALDLIGERWTLLIIRQLLSGDQRYSELQNALAGISSNLLSMRLRKLSEAALVELVTLHGGGNIYRLTPSGEALATVVWSLDAWAHQYVDNTRPNLPRHDRCGQALFVQWFCAKCQRQVEELELDLAPGIS